VAPHLRAGRLRLVLHGQHDAAEREIVMHYPHRQYLSARVRVVVDELLEHLRGERDLHLDPKALPSSWCA
jgi:DNA-binding transcriptional LysR family regulator